MTDNDALAAVAAVPPPPAAAALAPPHPAAGEEHNECCLCLNAPKTHALTPCGHTCVCEGCSRLFEQDHLPRGKRLRDFPICKARVNRTMRVYDS